MFCTRSTAAAVQSVLHFVVCSKKQKLVDELLQPESAYPRPTYIAADLSTTSIDRVLLQQQSAGNNSSTQGSSNFDPTAPTLFTVEGLIYYLPEVAVQQLFRAILKVAAPGSRVAFDFLHKDVGLMPVPHLPHLHLNNIYPSYL